ncbi:hypothetical protein ACHAXS_007445 [Conticribra weissflogii]
MSVIEKSFRKYITSFDGQKIEFEKVKPLFDDLYHDDFIIRIDEGHSINKDQLSRLQANILSVGTKASVIQFDHISEDEVSYVIHLLNDQSDIIISLNALVKDNKLVHAKSLCGYNDKKSLSDLVDQSNCIGIYKKVKYYLSFYDGKIKSFGTMENAFEDLFHDDFVNTTDGLNMVTKGELKNAARLILSQRVNMDLLTFDYINENHFEATVRIEKEDVDFVAHIIGTINDGKLIKLVPCDDVNEIIDFMMNAVEKSSEIESKAFEQLDIQKKVIAFFSFLDGKVKSFMDVEKSFEDLFHEDFINAIDGPTPINKDEYRNTVSTCISSKGIRMDLILFEFIDDTHFRMKVVAKNELGA